jgi:hypothetical protein
VKILTSGEQHHWFSGFHCWRVLPNNILITGVSISEKIECTRNVVLEYGIYSSFLKQKFKKNLHVMIKCGNGEYRLR